MNNSDNIKTLLESKYPLFWSLLSNNARKNLPKGIIEVCTGSLSEIKSVMNILEGYLKDLNNICSGNSVEHNYRRQLSNISSKNQLVELFHEVALCVYVGKRSNGLQLHPHTGRGTYSDCLFNVNGFDVYGEVKRYVDTFPYILKLGSTYDSDTEIPYSRSISKNEKHGNSARSRSMDLRSKLKDVYKQFPEKSINILFVFHPSLGESNRYIKQTLFGDSSFLNYEDKCELKPDGLFSLKEWQNVSACFLARSGEESKIILPSYWKNPNAVCEMPDVVLDTLLRA